MSYLSRTHASLLTALLFSSVALAEVNQAKIGQVAAGEVQEARASWWGFNSEDATESLQVAINSGVAKLTEDNTGKPWVVHHRDGSQTIVINQRKKAEIKGCWTSLGTFDFDQHARVVVSNEGTTGYVIADAVQFLSFDATTASVP